MTRFYFFLTLITLIALPNRVLSHGANIQYGETTAIKIQAKYDDGTPMGNAQVVIYAPSDRATPWLKGVTDDDGSFTFVPDRQPANIGNWDVKVRQSGHGDITSIPIEDNTIATNDEAASSVPDTNTNAYTSTQKVVMAAAGVWGFIGTALFFFRSKSA